MPHDAGRWQGVNLHTLPSEELNSHLSFRCETVLAHKEGVKKHKVGESVGAEVPQPSWFIRINLFVRVRIWWKNDLGPR